jgi:hypothetical protein
MNLMGSGGDAPAAMAVRSKKNTERRTGDRRVFMTDSRFQTRI